MKKKTNQIVILPNFEERKEFKKFFAVINENIKIVIIYSIIYL